jgi:hypothetical protein
VWRAEHALERPAVLGLLEQREDTATVVVHHHENQIRARLAGAEEQAGRVVQERQVTQQGSGRAATAPLMCQGGARRGGNRPVDPARAAAGEHAQPRARRHLLVEVTDRQAGRRPQQRAVRQRRGQVTGQPGLGEQVTTVEDRGRGGLGRRVSRSPGRQPFGARWPAAPAGQPDRRRHVGGAARRVGPVSPALGDDHVPGGLTGTGGRPQVSQLRPGQARPARRHDDVWPVTGHELGRVKQVRVGGEAHRPGPRPRRGLGEYRPAGLPGQPKEGCRVAAAVAADDHSPLGPRQFKDWAGHGAEIAVPGRA